MAAIQLSTVELWEVREGDVLIARVRDPIREDERRRLEKWLVDLFEPRGVSVVVLSDRVTFSVARKWESAPEQKP